MSMFSKFREKIEAWMNAVAFAEANDHDAALAMVGADPEKQKSFSLDAVTTAVAFAEAGEHDLALSYLKGEGRKKAAVLEFPGVRVWTGRVRVDTANPVPALAGVRVWCGRVAA
ncbi:MAG: hypothetical protein JRI97_08265 [Deltaproteobacteria bacterium]|nr:hypothetical protein [Deltaproteobacteria bacterium]